MESCGPRRTRVPGRHSISLFPLPVTRFSRIRAAAYWNRRWPGDNPLHALTTGPIAMSSESVERQVWPAHPVIVRKPATSPAAGARAASMNELGHGTPVVRSDYLIDRFHVVFEWGGGWQCGCADFVASNACRHTREAAGRRAAQSRIAHHVGKARSELGPLAGRHVRPGWPGPASTSDLAASATS